MKKSTALILCCALVLVSGQESGKKTTSTEVPTTTVHTTTTFSTTPSTTSSKPTTTSTTPSTTSTSSTTPAPETTTDIHSTTTVAPPTPKDPEPNTWSANGTDHNVIIVRLATQLVISYNSTYNKTLSVAINVPANKNITNAVGTFGANDETLTLSWKSSKGGENVVSLGFKRDNVTKTYILSRLEASIAPDELPNSNFTAPLKLLHPHEHFNTTIGNSYRCVRLQHFNLTKENEKTPTGVAKVTDLRFQAFENKNKGGFGLAEDCAFDTPDAVPIAVGCALAGLVVIVLVAYLVSRRRSQARGYLSM